MMFKNMSLFEFISTLSFHSVSGVSFIVFTLNIKNNVIIRVTLYARGKNYIVRQPKY